MNVGRKIYGFCNGYFGRDDYEDKIILFEGLKWIVCLYDDGTIACCNFDNEEEKLNCIEQWSNKE